MENRARNTYKFYLTSGLISISGIREQAAYTFSGIIPDEEMYGFKLVLTEMLNNAVIHGGSLGENFRVSGTIEYSPLTNEIKMEISDSGNGFDWYDVCRESHTTPHEEAVMKENGRGFMLVRAYGYSYRFNESGNTVTLVKKI